MQKLKFDFYAKRPPQTQAQFLSRLVPLIMGALALSGLVIILGSYARSDRKPEWGWESRDIRKNFMPIYTIEENDRRFHEAMKQYRDAVQFADDPPANRPKPETNRPALPGEGTPTETPPAPPPALPPDEREQREIQLIEELRRGVYLKIDDELATIPTFEPIKDWRPAYRSHVMSERSANRGRQAPPYEQLAFQILRKLPAPGAANRKEFEDKVEKGRFYFGYGQSAVEAYRGRAFEAEGRLFDFYEVKLDRPVVLADGTAIERYYEGIVVFLREGRSFGEFPIVQQQVLIQSLTCPQALNPWLNGGTTLTHEDKLAKQAVFVRCSGVFLRNFVYSRPVAPFSTPEKAVESQAFVPLLLTADLEPVQREGYQLTEQLLQQVRDSLRDDIEFLQDEAAYYAMLARAAEGPQDFNVIEEVGYFDLANRETGPRYRGQGIQVYGMIGDNYAPVILPPNISGLRRVFRCYVAGSMTDLATPNRWLVDMIELPPGLEARAPVKFKARYYRNIFEAENNTAQIRPLLVVHKVERYYRSDDSQDWIFALVLLAGGFFMFGALAWFLYSDGRARARFEQDNLARIRERVQKTGGLKLKPLPDAKPRQDAAPKDAEPPPA